MITLDVLVRVNKIPNARKLLGVKIIPVWDVHLNIASLCPQKPVALFAYKNFLQQLSAVKTLERFTLPCAIWRKKET